jgi:hypothetical protein
MLEPARLIDVGAIERGLQHIVAVDRKDMLGLDPTNRAERHPIEVLVLRKILTRGVSVGTRHDRDVTNRECADPSCG